MKEKILIGVLLILAVSFGAYVYTPSIAKGLNVNEVASDPGAYSGTITITGVTAAFAQEDETLFGIMDVKELMCTSTTCQKEIIPIRFQEQLPRLGDQVQITGAFEKDDKGYFFKADQVVVTQNHQLRR